MGGTNEHQSARAHTLSAALLAPVLLLPLLEHGGLAPILIATGVALLAGVPAALIQWRTASLPLGSPVLVATLSSGLEVATLLWLGATVSEAATVGLWPEGSAVWVLPLVWALAVFLMRRPVWLSAVALVSVLGLSIVAGRGLWTASPWTLLEPRWEPWELYISPAILFGLLLPGVGTGVWSAFVRRPPGERHAPWGAAGLGILAAVALITERAVHYEQGLGEIGAPSLSVQFLSVLMFACGVGALSVRERMSRPSQLVRLLAGLFVALLLAGPAAGARPFVISALIPALALFSLLSAALRSRKAERITMLAAGAAVAVAGAFAWPGLPVRVFDAAMLGAFFVGAFWVVATRSVLAGRTT